MKILLNDAINEERIDQKLDVSSKERRSQEAQILGLASIFREMPWELKIGEREII